MLDVGLDSRAEDLDDGHAGEHLEHQEHGCAVKGIAPADLQPVMSGYRGPDR